MSGSVKATRDAGVGVSPKSIADEELRAAKLRAFWGTQGHKVQTRVELIRKVEGEEFYFPGVRSDMLNGYPRDHPANARLLAKLEEPV